MGNDILKEGYYYYEGTPKCVAIADGVGGNPGGKEASEFIASRMRELNGDELIEEGRAINSQLLQYAKSLTDKENMATTFTGLFMTENHPSRILHIGNTRLFAIRGDYLKQLTRDHTTVEWLKSRGQYEAAEIAPSNEITACFGGGNEARLKQLCTVDIDKTYAGYVLTSDGIHDYVDIEVIEEFVSNQCFSEEAFERLVDMARDSGSNDDVSIIVLITQE